MSTISITVDSPGHALMLVEWLKNIRFVQDVNYKIDELSPGNVSAVNKVLDTIKSTQMLANITDPVAYQNTVRNEWS